MMDNLFDCLNDKNTMEYKVKQKPFLKPYTSVDDVRFAWLDQFLDYFEQWNDQRILHRMINPVHSVHFVENSIMEGCGWQP